MISPELTDTFPIWLASIWAQAKRDHQLPSGQIIIEQIEKLAADARHEQDLRWLMRTGLDFARKHQISMPPAPSEGWVSSLRCFATTMAQIEADRLNPRRFGAVLREKATKVSRTVFLYPETILWLEKYSTPDARVALAGGIERAVKALITAEQAQKDPFD